MQVPSLNQPTKVIIKARNAVLVFIAELLTNPETAFECLSSQLFSIRFLCLMFECRLTDTTVQVFRNTIAHLAQLDIPRPVRVLTRIVESCIQHFERPHYESLVVLISDAVVVALMQDRKLAATFGLLLPAFLKFVHVCPNAKVLHRSFVFLTLLASLDRRFELSPKMFSDLLIAIELVDHGEPSAQTEDHLLCFMRPGFSRIPGAGFLIANASAIPLTFAAFGRSKRLGALVRFLQSLCEISDHNIKMFHQGDMDFLILQYIVQNERVAMMSYRDHRFSLEFSDEQVQTILWPFFTRIATVKSSNAISSLLVAHLVSTLDLDFAEHVSQLIVRSASRPKTVYALGSIGPHFEVQGILGDELMASFTIHFRLNIDLPLVTEASLRIQVLDILAANGNRLSLSIYQGSFHAKYDDKLFVSQVTMSPIKVANSWQHYTFSANLEQGPPRILNWWNKKSMNDSSFC
jgi:hypothetical protein